MTCFLLWDTIYFKIFQNIQADEGVIKKHVVLKRIENPKCRKVTWEINVRNRGNVIERRTALSCMR